MKGLQWLNRWCRFDAWLDIEHVHRRPTKFPASKLNLFAICCQFQIALRSWRYDFHFVFGPNLEPNVEGIHEVLALWPGYGDQVSGEQLQHSFTAVSWGTYSQLTAAATNFPGKWWVLVARVMGSTLLEDLEGIWLVWCSGLGAFLAEIHPCIVSLLLGRSSCLPTEGTNFAWRRGDLVALQNAPVKWPEAKWHQDMAVIPHRRLEFPVLNGAQTADQAEH